MDLVQNKFTLDTTSSDCPDTKIRDTLGETPAPDYGVMVHRMFKKGDTVHILQVDTGIRVVRQKAQPGRQADLGDQRVAHPDLQADLGDRQADHPDRHTDHHPAQH